MNIVLYCAIRRIETFSLFFPTKCPANIILVCRAETAKQMSETERINGMNETNWRELTAKASNGDSGAFEELYRASRQSVYFICSKMLRSESDINDAMQETYFTAYQKLSALDDGANFLRWVNGIAANKCREIFRRRQDDSLEEKIEEGIEFSDEEFIPDAYVTDQDRRKIIMQIIETSLSDVQRQTVILYYYNELTVAQISGEMECPEGTVKYRLCTAREKIKEAILIYEKEHNDKLHVLVPIPVLTKILRIEAEQTGVPDIPLRLPKAASSPANIVKQAGGTSMKTAITGKLIAGVVAVTAAVAGLAALANKNSSDTPKQADPVPAVTTYAAGTGTEGTKTTSVQTTGKAAPAQTTDTAEEPAYSFAPSEEILNAPLTSGYIQICDDIFRAGGYLTVNDFLSQYGSSWTTQEGFDASMEMKGENYFVKVTNKKSDTLEMELACAVSPTEDHSLGNAVIVNYRTGEKVGENAWLPGGYRCWNGRNTLDEVRAAYQGLNYTEVFETKYSEPITESKPTKNVGSCLIRTIESQENNYTRSESLSAIVELSEENLFGVKPVFSMFYRMSDPYDANATMNSFHSAVKSAQEGNVVEAPEIIADSEKRYSSCMFNRIFYREKKVLS